MNKTINMANLLKISGFFAAAVLAFFCALTFAGHTPLTVRSGSMGNAIPVGSLAFAKRKARNTLSVGEVIMVQPARGGTPYIHRVVEIQNERGKLLAITKGDAVGQNDPHPYTLPAFVPVIGIHVPLLGRLLVLFTSKAGIALFLFLGLPVFIFKDKLISIVRGQNTRAAV